MKLADNVQGFLDWCSREVGKYQEDLFSEDTWYEIFDLEIESPIEQILYCAIKAVCHFNDIKHSDPELIDDKEIITGFDVSPQYNIGKYRVDFLVYYGFNIHVADRIKAPKRRQDNERFFISEVIVECDSQQFHDRTEQERRYEKKRDRFLQSNGYAVFRYTGSDIVKRPMEIAGEIISFVTGIEKDDLLLDSNIAD